MISTLRRILFYLVIETGANVLKALHFILKTVAQITEATARRIDPVLADFHQASVDQEDELSELSLVAHMLSIKDEAVAEEDWSMEHQARLERVVTILHMRHGWEQEDIDDYLARLVASGPEGYQYENPDDSDFDED